MEPRIQDVEEPWYLPIAIDSSKLVFREKQAGTNPTLALVAGPPPLDVTARGADRVGNGFNRIGGAKRLAQRGRHVQLVESKSFFQSLLQAARGAGVRTHQLTVDVV